MLIISLDAVGDSELDRLSEYPSIAGFRKEAGLVRDVSTVFLSNTYPIHTSVVTGVTPDVHGLISNTEAFPKRFPVWNSGEDCIKSETLWQAAASRNIDTAAVFWPVTAYSKSIRYNIPEVLARPGESQLLTSLMAGSKLLQLKMFLRHRKKLSLTEFQPYVDDFAAACMADILSEYKPGLAFVHLSAYDTLRHAHGKNSEGEKRGMQSLNDNLAVLLKAAKDRPVLIFSDHTQLDLKKVIDPNEILVKEGKISRDDRVYIAGESGCFVECCGGSAFFHKGKLSDNEVTDIKEKLSKSEGFGRFLTEDEMCVSGHKDKAFGFSAETGYCYEAFAPEKKANHGYPLDTPDYKVFYMIRGLGFEPGSVTYGGSLLQIAPIVKKYLGERD